MYMCEDFSTFLRVRLENRADQPRTAHFPSLRTPVLFVHGTRDGFGSIEEPRTALDLIPARAGLLAVEGAGHELVSARTKADAARSIVQAFSHFQAGTTGRS